MPDDVQKTTPRDVWKAVDAELSAACRNPSTSREAYEAIQQRWSAARQAYDMWRARDV